MWQDYLICIKHIKHSNDAKREYELVTLSDESDEDEEEDDDQAQCIMCKKNTLSKHDAKEKMWS